MRIAIFLILINLANISIIFSQQPDSIKAKQFEQKAKELFDRFRYDSAANYYKQAAEIYEEEESWLNCVRNYRLTATSFLKVHKIGTSLFISNKAINLTNKHFIKNSKKEAFEMVELLLIKGRVIILQKPILGKKAVEKDLEPFYKALEILEQTDSKAELLKAKVWNYIGWASVFTGELEKGLEYNKKSLLLRQNLLRRKHTDIVRSYYSLGLTYYHLKDYDTSLEHIKKAASIWLEIYRNKHPDVAECYRVMGAIYNNLGENKKALEWHEKSLKMRLTIYGNDSFSVGGGYVETGRVYHKIGNFDKALAYYKEAEKIYTPTTENNFSVLADIYELIGFIYGERGDYEKTIKHYTKALSLRKQLWGENHIFVVKSYVYLGMVNEEVGKYDKALAYFEKSLEIISLLYDKKHQNFTAVYLKIGDAYLMKGDYNRALEYLKKSLSIRSEKFDENFRGNYMIYHSIGEVFRRQREYDKALNYYHKSTDILIESFGEKHHSVARNYNDLGLVYGLSGDYNKSLEYYQKALDVLIKIYGDKSLNVANTYNNFGETYFAMGKYEKALGYYNKGLQIRLNTFGKQHPDVSISYNKIGKVFLKRGKFNKALENYQNALIANHKTYIDSSIYAIPESLNAFSKPILLQTLNNKALSFYKSYEDTNHKISDLKAALSNYELALGLIHELRNDYANENSQLSLSNDTKDIFLNAVSTAIEFNELDTAKKSIGKAFEYIEKSKSATLSSYLKDADIKQYWNISDSLLRKENNIAVNRKSLEIQIQKVTSKNRGYDTSLVQNLQGELFLNSQQKDSLLSTFKEKYPNYYKLKYEQKVASVDEVKIRLGENGALLNYFVADTMLFIAAVNKDTIVYKTINTDSLFNQQIIDYHIDIKSEFRKRDLKSNVNLYNYLIKPVEKIIENKNNLVIIPDGNLYYIPFETLCKSESYSNDLTKLDYLVKKHTISYHQSATLWLNSVEKSKGKETINDNFLGFAPVFDPKINNGYIVSNEWVTDTTNIELATRSISADLKHLNALPYSEKEINAILKLFKKKNKKGIGYLHQKATEENFKQKSNDYKYLHIASHSFTNDKYPALSGIAFSQPDTTDFDDSKKEDGILYAGESYNLNLTKADLVVLSSCKSGLGKLVKGEGFLSLSRGFLYAGVPNIIFSLWNVKDEQTKDLMVQFYKQVLKGKSYAEALRDAKLKLITNPETAMPEYWAAWTLVGK